MKSHYSFWALALLSLCAFSTQRPAIGQDVVAPAAANAAPSDAAVSAGTTQEVAACCTLPDGAVIELEIAEPLSSKTAQRGQRFKLRVASSVYAGNAMLIPAGTQGFGEVVHADRARAAGKPGELLLAGRALDGPNGEIKLRGFRLGGSGENRVNAAFWIPLGFFIRGGQIELPAGTRAHAKLAGPHRFVPVPTPANTARPAPSSSDPTLTPAPVDRDKDTPQSSPQP